MRRNSFEQGIPEAFPFDQRGGHMVERDDPKKPPVPT